MTTGTAAARLRWIAFGVPAVFLAAFHGALLVHRFADASIARPMVLGRWAFAIVLLAALFLARRLFSRRRVVITFWLLVAVLHLAVPDADRVFDAREDVALLVAVLPALIVTGAAGRTPARVAAGINASFRRLDRISAAEARSDSCRSRSSFVLSAPPPRTHDLRRRDLSS